MTNIPDRKKYERAERYAARIMTQNPNLKAEIEITKSNRKVIYIALNGKYIKVVYYR